jgi:hypothetical protein
MSPIGIESDDLNDLEPGCTVWSSQLQDSYGFVGGVVYHVDPVMETVEVIRRSYRDRPPLTATIPFTEINREAIEFFTRDARIVAQNIMGWLSKPAERDPRRAQWMDRAVRLASIAETGQFTPKAEERFQRAQRKKFEEE